MGMAIGPAVGSAISQRYSLDALFYCSSAFALLSIVILMNMKETLPVRQRFRWSILRISLHDIIDLRVIPAAVVTLMSYVAYVVILTLIPVWSDHLFIVNTGLFFVALTIAALVIRFVAGGLSDLCGRVSVIRIDLVILIVSLLLLWLGESPP